LAFEVDVQPAGVLESFGYRDGDGTDGLRGLDFFTERSIRA
jgi:hypothetical protein